MTTLSRSSGYGLVRVKLARPAPKFYVTAHKDNFSCAPACLYSVHALLGYKPPNYQDLCDILETTRTAGTYSSRLGDLQMLWRMGLPAVASGDRVYKQGLAIILVQVADGPNYSTIYDRTSDWFKRSENKTNHYIVALGVKNGRLSFYDPAHGNYQTIDIERLSWRSRENPNSWAVTFYCEKDLTLPRNRLPVIHQVKPADIHLPFFAPHPATAFEPDGTKVPAQGRLVCSIPRIDKQTANKYMIATNYRFR